MSETPVPSASLEHRLLLMVCSLRRMSGVTGACGHPACDTYVEAADAIAAQREALQQIVDLTDEVRNGQLQRARQIARAAPDQPETRR